MGAWGEGRMYPRGRAVEIEGCAVVALHPVGGQVCGIGGAGERLREPEPLALTCCAPHETHTVRKQPLLHHGERGFVRAACCVCEWEVQRREGEETASI